jgi:hypothetical protein
MGKPLITWLFLRWLAVLSMPLQDLNRHILQKSINKKAQTLAELSLRLNMAEREGFEPPDL